MLSGKEVAGKVLRMKLEDAIVFIETEQYEHHIVRDGTKHKNPGAGFCKTRINLEVDKGTITKAYVG